MAGGRTLKLSILADIANFTAGMDSAGKKTSTIGDEFSDFAKKATLAFAAAGAAISAYVGTAIKNAAEDEKAQRNLALTIENTTSATAAQIAGVEKYISKTSIAIGVTDDQLRPAFGRLVRSTKDVEDAQKLLNLALDVSAATGKPLEAVANALGKAYDGNLNALGRLGLGIDQSILKSKDFDLVFQNLTSTFGGFADNEANSTQKAFERIKIASDEVQEQIGAALLPVVQELTTFILTDVVPIVQQFVDGLTGQGGLEDGLTNSEKSAYQWGERIKSVIKTVISLKDEIIAVGTVIGTVFVISKISAYVTAAVAAIQLLIKAYNALKTSSIIAGVASYFALNPLAGVAAAAVAAGVLAAANSLASRFDTATDFSTSTPSSGGFSGTMPNGQPFVTGGGTAGGAGGGGTGGGAGAGGFTGGGGGSTSSTTIKVDPSIAAASKKAQEASANLNEVLDRISGTVNNGFNVGSFRMAEARDSGTTINLTVNGAFDREGVARQIVQTLNDSAYRGTGGAGNLVAL